jgi:two-component system response regulator FixJ
MRVAGPESTRLRTPDRHGAVDPIQVVHVIDDDDVFRSRLCSFLRSHGLEVVGYTSATSFLDQLACAESGCLVTDVRMPEMTGLELLGRLADQRSRFPTIVLTGGANVRMAVEALKLGAAEFIEKPFEPDLLLAAIRRALSKLDEDLRRARRTEADARSLAALSGRERNVLDGVLKGQSNKEIARDLAISPRSVEAYRAKLMMKMDAESLPELIQRTLSADKTSEV